MTAAPYRCPTPCDEDCEINGWGCHESHIPTWKREHDLQACEAKMLEENILHLIDAGWFLQIGGCGVPEGRPPMWFAALRKPEKRVQVSHYGASIAVAVGKAAEWVRQGATT